MKKKIKLTTSKLIRMTPTQKVNSKETSFSSVVRLLADHWGTRKARTVENIIGTTLKD